MSELAALRTLRDAVRSFLSGASWREVHCGYLAYQCTVEPSARDDLRSALAGLPLSRKPTDLDKHNSWCGLHLGGATCNCDWFEKQARPRCDCDLVSDTLKKLRAEKEARIQLVTEEEDPRLLPWFGTSCNGKACGFCHTCRDDGTRERLEKPCTCETSPGALCPKCHAGIDR